MDYYKNLVSFFNQRISFSFECFELNRSTSTKNIAKNKPLCIFSKIEYS